MVTVKKKLLLLLLLIFSMTVSNATFVMGSNVTGFLEEYSAEEKDFTINGTNYNIKLNISLFISKKAGFWHNGELSNIIGVGESYVFSDGLRIHLDEIRASEFDGHTWTYFTLDVVEEKEQVSTNVDYIKGNLYENYEDVKTFNISGIDYTLRLNIALPKSRAVRLEHNGELSEMMKINDSFIFSDGLRVHLDELKLSGFDGSVKAHFTLDVVEEQEPLSTEVEKRLGFFQKIIDWFIRLFE